MAIRYDSPSLIILSISRYCGTDIKLAESQHKGELEGKNILDFNKTFLKGQPL